MVFKKASHLFILALAVFSFTPMLATPVPSAHVAVASFLAQVSTPSPSPSPSCYTVTQYLHDNTRDFLILEYRGIPSAATSQRLRDLNKKVFKDLVPSLPASLCLSNTDKEDFEKKAVSAVEFALQVENLAYKTKNSLHFFYLNQVDYSKSVIGVDTQAFSAEFELIWNQKRAIYQDNYNTKTAELPKDELKKVSELNRTAAVFYEPHAIELQTGYTTNYSVNVEISGDTFLYECLSVVYTLELLQVSRQKSIKIFSHCVAFLFQSIRLKRLENDKVGVSPFFLSMYHGALEYYTKGMNGADVVKNTITRQILPAAMDDVQNVYLEFDSWGRADYIDWVTLTPVNPETILFSDKIMGDLKSKISPRIVTPQIMKRFERGPVSHSVHSAVWTSSRSNAYCDTEVFSWYERAGASNDENCCALMCDNAAVLADLAMGKSGCCALCNQATCDISTPPLSNLQSVYLIPYGYQELDPLTILL